MYIAHTSRWLYFASLRLFFGFLSLLFAGPVLRFFFFGRIVSCSATASSKNYTHERAGNGKLYSNNNAGKNGSNCKGSQIESHTKKCCQAVLLLQRLAGVPVAKQKVATTPPVPRPARLAAAPPGVLALQFELHFAASFMGFSYRLHWNRMFK